MAVKTYVPAPRSAIAGTHIEGRCEPAYLDADTIVPGSQVFVRWTRAIGAERRVTSGAVPREISDQWSIEVDARRLQQRIDGEDVHRIGFPRNGVHGARHFRFCYSTVHPWCLEDGLCAAVITVCILNRRHHADRVVLHSCHTPKIRGWRASRRLHASAQAAGNGALMPAMKTLD